MGKRPAAAAREGLGDRQIRHRRHLPGQQRLDLLRLILGTLHRSEAKAYMDKYFETYSGVRAYMTGVVERARTDGYVSTQMGRRRWLPELRSSNFNTRSFGERVALNMPIQGTAADVIKLAMIRVRDAIRAEGLKAQLIRPGGGKTLPLDLGDGRDMRAVHRYQLIVFHRYQGQRCRGQGVYGAVSCYLFRRSRLPEQCGRGGQGERVCLDFNRAHCRYSKIQTMISCCPRSFSNTSTFVE